MATEVLTYGSGYDSGVVAAGAPAVISLTKIKAQRVADVSARFQEAVLRGRVFAMSLTATSTGAAAGNIVGAAAAASTNFAIWNPAASGVNFVLWQLGMGIISGTAGAGPLWHSYVTAGTPTVATTGSIRNCLCGSGTGSAALGWATAAGTTLTGGGALITLRAANFASTNTAQASVGMVNATEWIDGSIIIPPSVGYVPCHPAAGTSLLNGWSLVWEEVPV